MQYPRSVGLTRSSAGKRRAAVFKEQPPWSIRCIGLVGCSGNLDSDGRSFRRSDCRQRFWIGVVVSLATLVLGRSKAAWVLVLFAPAIRLALGGTQPWWVRREPGHSDNSPDSPVVLSICLGGVWRLGTYGAPDEVRLRLGSARRGCRRNRAEPGPLLDPRVYTDDARPVGWYMDPESPRRMEILG